MLGIRAGLTQGLGFAREEEGRKTGVPGHSDWNLRVRGQKTTAAKIVFLGRREWRLRAGYPDTSRRHCYSDRPLWGDGLDQHRRPEVANSPGYEPDVAHQSVHLLWRALPTALAGNEHQHVEHRSKTAHVT